MDYTLPSKMETGKMYNDTRSSSMLSAKTHFSSKDTNNLKVKNRPKVDVTINFRHNGRNIRRN